MLAAVASLAAATTGCGEKSEPKPPRELSANALIAQGDEICDRARAQVREATATPVDDAAGNARVVGELIAISEREVDGLAALEPPDELTEPLARYLSSREEALELLREARRAAQSEQAFEFAAIESEISDSQPARTRAAGDVGFETCSRVGDTALNEPAPRPDPKPSRPPGGRERRDDARGGSRNP